MTRRVTAVVSGHVQGVGYRVACAREAGATGLAGSVRNLPDGRVEVVLEGEDDAVRSAVAALSGRGAPGSVSRVDTREEQVQGSRGFTVQ
jgi:acylphosphatase